RLRDRRRGINPHRTRTTARDRSEGTPAIDLSFQRGWDTQLYLVQHGEAKPETDDPERPLTERGQETVRQMAVWAFQVGVRAALLRHGGKRRAEQPATLLGEWLKPPKGVVTAGGLKPNDDPRPLAESLQAEPEPLMLVGHLPFLSRLASLLVGGNSEGHVIHF